MPCPLDSGGAERTTKHNSARDPIFFSSYEITLCLKGLFCGSFCVSIQDV